MKEQTGMADEPTGARVRCDCCKAEVHRVDEDGLCFGCETVQSFVSIIGEQAGVSGDAAVDLACELAEHVRSRILELGNDVTPEERATFFADVASGMTRVARSH